MEFTSDGQCYIAGCSDGTIRLMEKFTGEMLNEYTGHVTEDYQVESVISQDGSVVVSGSVSGEIFVWDFLNATVENKLIHTPRKVVQSLCAHPNFNAFVSASGTSIKVWATDVAWGDIQKNK